MKRIIFISLISLILTSCEKDMKLLDEIYNEPGYAIGKITRSTSIFSMLTYYYEFKIGFATYKGEKKDGISTSSNSHLIGRQYLVVYKIGEPGKSDLNFRYPINSEQEFLDLVEGFKDNPPKY